MSDTASLRLAGLRSAIEATFSAETGSLSTPLMGAASIRDCGGGQVLAEQPLCDEAAEGVADDDRRGLSPRMIPA